VDFDNKRLLAELIRLYEAIKRGFTGRSGGCIEGGSTLRASIHLADVPELSGCGI